MIQHVVQKKRVIVMDCDITLGEDVWKKIMRHVLGRHFADLRGKGPGWSFSHTHLGTFCSMVKEALLLVSDEKDTTSVGSGGEPSSVQTSQNQTIDEEPVSFDEKSFQDSETQTTDDEEEQSVPDIENRTLDEEEEQQTGQNSCGTQTTDDEEEHSVRDIETQTCSKIFLETTKKSGHVYKFDVDDQIRFFVDHWTQKIKLFLV